MLRKWKKKTKKQKRSVSVGPFGHFDKDDLSVGVQTRDEKLQFLNPPNLLAKKIHVFFF